MDKNVSWWKISPGRQGKDWNDWVEKNYCILYNWPEQPYYGMIKMDLKKDYKSPEEFLEKTGFKGGVKQDWRLQLKTFVWDVVEGDIAFAYKKSEFVGFGKIGSYHYDKNIGHIRDIIWEKIEPPLNLTKSILIDELGIPAAGTIKNIGVYKNEILQLLKQNHTIININSDYNDLLDLLNHKSQIIFYGPPGTGKTYMARDFAVNFIENHLEEE